MRQATIFEKMSLKLKIPTTGHWSSTGKTYKVLIFPNKYKEAIMAKRVESPSSINTFKQCARKYYYQYLLKLPTVPNIHQVRGNIVHSTLENFYNIDITTLDENTYPLKIRETIQKLFLHYWQEYKPKLNNLKLNQDQERFYFEETMLMLLNWANHFIDDITKTKHHRTISLQEAFVLLTPIREQEFISEKHSVKGFVDAIHYLDGEVHILDYKTNSSFEFKDSIKLQLGIYSLLYYEMYNIMPAKVGIFFLRDKPKWLNVDATLLDLAKREIECIHQHTSSFELIEHYPQTVTGLCKWSTGQCDFYNTCKPHEK
jgi:RecB family exonuclease